jgi:hypothetical protein
MKKADKVICIDDDFSMYSTIHEFYSHLPVKNEIYTIREVRPKAAEGGILLKEIRNKPIYNAQYMGNLEPAFHPRRFVPLEETELKIEIKEEIPIVCIKMI